MSTADAVIRCFGAQKQEIPQLSTLMEMDARVVYSTVAPPSKSASHRAMICAALAQGTTRLENFAYSQDMLATLRCVEALGAKVVRGEDWVTITGIDMPSPRARMDCGESGSTLRFFVPIAAALGCKAVFTGQGKLPTRPIAPLVEAMTPHGITFDYQGTMPFSLSGKLEGGVFEIAGDISSQYVTGLLFAAPLLTKDTVIRLTTPLTSRSYVDMTVQTMQDFGITIIPTQDGWQIPGNQRYRCQNRYPVECDYSNAAFFLTAGAIGGRAVTVRGLRRCSTQGDRAILELLSRFGASVTVEEDGTVFVAPRPLQAITIDAQDIPDLVPILCVAACHAAGTTRITHVGRLRYKESDRLAAMADCLTRLGGIVKVGEDEINITGAPLHGGRVNGFNDHRIVMSMAIAALIASSPVEITGYTAVNKSYPNFFEIYQTFGGICNVLNLE